MMNIREYFEMMRETQGYNAMEDTELELYNLYEDDYDAFECYCEMHDIDLTAREEGKNETVLTLWLWDMCGE